MATPAISREESLTLALSQGTYGTDGSFAQWSYYDTMVVSDAVADRENTLFVNPLGQNGKVLTDTNMIAAGQIPTGQHFRINGIKVEYKGDGEKTPDDLVALYDLLSSTSVQFIIANKDATFQYSLSELMAIPMMFSAQPATGDNINAIEMPVAKNFPLNIPIILAQQTSFKVKLVHEKGIPVSTLNGDTIKISLAGVLLRLN